MNFVLVIFKLLRSAELKMKLLLIDDLAMTKPLRGCGVTPRLFYPTLRTEVPE